MLETRPPSAPLALLAGLALGAAALLAPATAQAAHATPRCAMAAADSLWLARALRGWAWTGRALLHLEPAPAPWIVVFDARCAWHLNASAGDSALRGGEPAILDGAAAVATAHDGQVALPTGARIPARLTAFTAPLGREERAMLALALPSVWRATPRHASDADLEALVLGVFMHEAAHTRQALAADRAIGAVAAHAALPEDLDDDVVQRRFGTRPGYREAYEREHALLWRAAEAADPAERRRLAREAARAMRERRARWFTGADSIYGALEDVFLSLEGVGNWTALGFMRAPEGLGLDRAEALRRLRGDGRSWTQDEGLALYLVLDALLPGWQRRALGAEGASGRALLEEAAR